MTDPLQAPALHPNLRRRILSGVVMAAGAIFVAWAGGPLFVVVWTLAGAVTGVEWAWLAAADPRGRRWAARIAAATLGIVGAAVGLSFYVSIGPAAIATAMAAGAVAVAVVARPHWSAGFAVPYGAAAFLGAIILRRDPDDGLLAILFVFAVVWMTDVAAFASGKTFGGPKLAPKISPNKTWSGAIGGAIVGSASGVAIAAAGGVTRLWPVAAVAFALAIATEIGDLVESSVKRVFGAKDSGSLIPGHGGLMDRLDGFLFAASLAAAIGVLRGGADAAGQGLLRW